MNVPQTVSEVLRSHVTLECEGIDRMYLNCYVPLLQSERGAASYIKKRFDLRMASTNAVAPMSEAFVKSVERFAKATGVDLVHFRSGQRKDDVTQELLAQFKGTEGVLYIGVAQEKASVLRTEKRRNVDTGALYPWLVKSTAMVKHYYFYCVDADFGPLFIKFCSYFPYNAKVCLNGHEYAKCQLRNRGIAFVPLDNGVQQCADPQALQQICDAMDAEQIDALVRKWLARLPHPFAPEDRAIGCRYDLSILQSEFSLTQVLDQPRCGRVFFEDVIRENLDIGRPSQVQLIFDRKIIRRTPGTFRSRVITEGVVPSLHLDYKHSRIKQYHKEGQALRTETTINNTRDFAIGKRLVNLPALRRVGFEANRRLLDVQKISHDCALGEDHVQRLQHAANVDGQRASALRFADQRVQHLMHVLLLFIASVEGFRNRDLRVPLATLLGKHPDQITPGQLTYDLRRLRLHGLIERIPRSHRYQITRLGLTTAMFYTRLYNRALRPALAQASPLACNYPQSLLRPMIALQDAIADHVRQVKLALKT